MRTTKRSTRYAALAVGLAFIAASCGSDGDSSNATTGGTTGGTTAAATAETTAGSRHPRQPLVAPKPLRQLRWRGDDVDDEDQPRRCLG